MGKRKLFLQILMALTFVFGAFGFAGCAELGIEDFHNHKWGRWEVQSQPTCEETGLQTRVCSTCKEVDEQAIEALGHDVGEYRYNNDATCIANGTQTAYCQREGCGEAVTVEAENTMLPHTFAAQEASEKYLKSAATCVDKAVYYVSCNDCGEASEETFTYGEALDHSFVNEAAEEYLVSAATCTAKAVYYKSCVCGKVSEETFTYGELIDHVYDKEVTEEAYLVKAVTCTEAAVYYKSCVCGKAGEETFEYGTGAGHTFDKEVATEQYFVSAATCTTAAVYYKSCVCGKAGEETFTYGEALGHSFVNEAAEEYLVSAATCTAAAIYYKSCSCGEVSEETFTYGDVAGHDFQNEACFVCGVKEQVMVIENNAVFCYDYNGVMKKNFEYKGLTFGADGKLEKGFVDIEEDTYYVADKNVQRGYKVVEDYLYNFGDEGKMKKDCTHDGKTFDENGRLQDRGLVDIENDTYYVKDDQKVAYDYKVLEDYVYNFGDNGKMKKDCDYDGKRFDEQGKLRGTELFIYVDLDVYYVRDNCIVRDFQIIEEHVYYFGDDGKMRKDTEVNGFLINSSGFVVSDGEAEIVIGGLVYWIQGDSLKEAQMSGIIYESDNDTNWSNNELLENVLCIAEIHGKTYTAYSNAEGVFDFGTFRAGKLSLTFTLEGYITATTEVNLVGDLNLAVVLDREVNNTLTGKITIADADTNFANDVPLSNATITLERNTSTNTFAKSTTTDTSGNYTFSGLTAGVYSLVVECEGYLTVRQTIYVRYNETTIQNVRIEAIPQADEGEVVANGYAAGKVVDARTGRNVQGLTVYIRNGLGVVEGDVVCTVYTDANGDYISEGLVPGNYTAQFVDERTLDDEDERYGTVYIAIKVLSGITISNQNAVVSNAVNGFSADSLRIVLKWGSTPSDLDSHLYANKTDGSHYHVYFSDKNFANANLDVDDTNSYGPETVTITTIEDGIYKYYVHDWSNKGSSNSTSLSNSGASVEIYIGNSATPEYRLYIPEGKQGTSWHVFTYDSVTEEFIIVNKIEHIQHNQMSTI